MNSRSCIPAFHLTPLLLQMPMEPTHTAMIHEGSFRCYAKSGYFSLKQGLYQMRLAVIELLHIICRDPYIVDIINQHNLKSMGGSQVSAASVAASPAAAAAPAAAISTGGSTGAAGNYATDVASSSQTSTSSPVPGGPHAKYL